MTEQAEDFDLLVDLPTDKDKPTHEEFKVFNRIFKEEKIAGTLFVEFKESIIVGILFVIFSLTYIDELLLKVVPSLQNHSPYVLLGIKVFIIIILFWFIKHFYLCRRDDS